MVLCTEDALSILPMDDGPDKESVRSMLHLRMMVAGHPEPTQALRLMDFVESPEPPCLEQFRAKTLMHVESRIMSAEHLLDVMAPNWPRIGCGFYVHTKFRYGRYADMATLPDRPSVYQQSFSLLPYLRAAAEKYWHEWSAGWRFYWMTVVEPVFYSMLQEFWGPQLRALLIEPHIVLQIVLRSARGEDVERQAWWVNRQGFEKAVLDRVVPIDDIVAIRRLKAESWILGF